MDKAIPIYIEEARRCLLNHNYGKAYAFYLLILKLNPRWQGLVADGFASSWREWSLQLREMGKIKELLTLYEQGCEVFMQNDMLHFHMGNALFHLNLKLEAIGMFRRALIFNEHCYEASISLENACRGVIDSWHFLMLNDRQRHLKFNEAISALMKSHDTVLDIGCGSGILSMLAVQNGAKVVNACEMSQAMQVVANECIAANKMEDKINLLRCHSSHILVDEADKFLKNNVAIPKKCSLLVTETVDAGLLGEGIVDSLSYAWKNLLISSENGGQVIPHSAKMFCAVVECEEIFNKHAVARHNFPQVLITSGVGFKNCSFNSLSASSNCLCSSKKCINICDLEPYTSETVSNLSVKFLLKSQELFYVNFNDPVAIEKIENELYKEIAFECLALDTGYADAIIVWFELNLLPNSCCIINTAVGTEHCWEQAVYPIRYYENNGEGKKVLPKRLMISQDDSIQVSFSVHCDCLSLRSFNVCNDRTDQNLFVQPMPCIETNLHVTVSEEQIQRINDSSYTNVCFRTLCSLKSWNKDSFILLDVSNGFDIFAIKTAQASNIVVYKYCQTAAIYAALQHLSNQCGINIKLTNELPSLNVKFDAIVSHVIEPSGLISPNALSNINQVKPLLSWSGYIIPNGFLLITQLVESDQLLSKCLVVSDENTLGLKISDTINDFRVSVHSDLEIRTLHYKALTNPTVALTCDFNEATDLMNLEKTIVIKTISSGKVHAVVFWFKIHVYENDYLNTMENTNHWKQAAYVFPSSRQISVSSADEVTLKTTCCDDSILFHVSKYCS